MDAGTEEGPMFMFIVLCLFYGLHPIKYGLQLHDHGKLWVPRPDQLRTAVLEK